VGKKKVNVQHREPSRRIRSAPELAAEFRCRRFGQRSRRRSRREGCCLSAAAWRPRRKVGREFLVESWCESQRTNDTLSVSEEALDTTHIQGTVDSSCNQPLVETIGRQPTDPSSSPLFSPPPIRLVRYRPNVKGLPPNT
jgi:hypothetical protein